MIVPTVGRIVWFRRRGDAGPLPAVVSAVLEYGHVNLLVFESDAMSYSVFNVPVVQPGDAAHSISGGSDYCEWTPYRVGQTKKVEAQDRTQRLRDDRKDFYLGLTRLLLENSIENKKPLFWVKYQEAVTRDRLDLVDQAWEITSRIFGHLEE